VITSPSNPRLRLVRRLRGRAQRSRLGLFVCEGQDLVDAALSAGLEPVDALVDAERPALLDRLRGAERVAPAVLADVSELAHAPRVIAVFRSADLPRAVEPPPALRLALWRVGDPANVGTLLRSAAAFGPAGMYLSSGCADPVGPKALRASMGAVFRVPLGRFEEAPAPRIALVPRGGPPLDGIELSDSLTFVLGAERHGLPADLVRGCDAVATIPGGPETESLNVGVAGSIALYEWRRRRRESGSVPNGFREAPA
jgi:TrmH family RNA methyltransferase